MTSHNMRSARRLQWAVFSILLVLCAAIFTLRPQRFLAHNTEFEPTPTETALPSSPDSYPPPSAITGADDNVVAWPEAPTRPFTEPESESQPAGGVVAGQVFLDKRPLPGVIVTLSSHDPPVVVGSAVTDALGKFQLDTIPAGVFDLQAEHRTDPRERPMRAHQNVVVEAGRTTQTTVRFPGAPSVIEGYITVRDEAPVAAHVAVSFVDDATETRFGVEADADGFYRATNVVPGSIWLDVAADTPDAATLRQRVRIEVPAGAVVRQDVTFSGSSTLSGAVVGMPSGDVAELLLIPEVFEIDVSDLESLQALRESAVAIASVADNGDYFMTPIEAGGYVLIALIYPNEPPSGAPIEEHFMVRTVDVTVREGEETRADLQL